MTTVAGGGSKSSIREASRQSKNLLGLRSTKTSGGTRGLGRCCMHSDIESVPTEPFNQAFNYV